MPSAERRFRALAKQRPEVRPQAEQVANALGQLRKAAAEHGVTDQVGHIFTNATKYADIAAGKIDPPTRRRLEQITARLRTGMTVEEQMHLDTLAAHEKRVLGHGHRTATARAAIAAGEEPTKAIKQAKDRIDAAVNRRSK